MPQLCPLPYMSLSGVAGTALPGWRLHTFDAGTDNPRATFGNASGTAANPNPVVADSQGRMAVWLLENVSYRLSMRDASDAIVWEADDIVGVGSGQDGGGGPVTAGEWLAQPDVPTFVAADQYTIPGDQTFEYHAGRRQRAQVGGGLSYSTITDSSFGGGVTTITVAVDSGSPPIDAGISSVELGINSAAPGRRSIHQDAIEGLNLSGKIIGEIRMWTTLVAPPGGWLLCDGTAVSRTTYANLFAVIGTGFGAGDGSTTFNLPDFRGRSPIGAGSDGTVDTQTLGVKDGFSNIQLQASQSGLQAHSHTSPWTSDAGPWAAGGTPGVGVQVPILATPNQSTSITPAAGAPDPHDNQSPALGVSFIIAH